MLNEPQWLTDLKSWEPTSDEKLPTWGERDDNVSMESPITRPELDAKLETIEARMDGRLLRMEAIAERISEDVRETRSDIKTLKTTVITTAIIAALTIVFGIAGFNAMLTSNMLTAFQAGQQTSQQK